MEEVIGLEGYIPNKQVVINSENIITSRGPATAIEFALAVLEKLEGKERAQSVRKGVLA
jgi:4-methyl-5(b-hydroxyethyl)-thiazole monophosphate biosynthesis